MPYSAQQVQIAENGKKHVIGPGKHIDRVLPGPISMYIDLYGGKGSGQFVGVFGQAYGYAEKIAQVGLAEVPQQDAV